MGLKSRLSVGSAVGLRSSKGLAKNFSRRAPQKTFGLLTLLFCVTFPIVALHFLEAQENGIFSKGVHILHWARSSESQTGFVEGTTVNTTEISVSKHGNFRLSANLNLEGGAIVSANDNASMTYVPKLSRLNIEWMLVPKGKSLLENRSKREDTLRITFNRESDKNPPSDKNPSKIVSKDSHKGPSRNVLEKDSQKSSAQRLDVQQEIHEKKSTVVEENAVRQAILRETEKPKAFTLPNSEYPPVTAIISTYNTGQYVQEALTKFLNQSWKGCQAIVIDDLSTDDTLDVIRNLSVQYPGVIRLFQMSRNSIGGVGTIYNVAISLLETDFFIFVDSDDLLGDGALRTLIEEQMRTGADMVIGSFSSFKDGRFEETNQIAYDGRYFDRVSDKVLTQTDQEYPLLYRVSPVPWTKLYSRSLVWKNNLRFDEVDHFFEDNPFHWRVLYYANKVAVVKHVVAHHRNRRGSTMETRMEALALYAYINNFFYICDMFKRCHSMRCQTARGVMYRKIGYPLRGYLNENSFHISQKIKDLLSEKVNALHKFGNLKSSPRKYDLSIAIPTQEGRFSTLAPLLNKILTFATNENKRWQIVITKKSKQGQDHSREDKFFQKLNTKHDNFYYFKVSTPEKQAGRMRNKILPSLVGEYIFFMDDDDDVDLFALSEMVDNARQEGADVSVARYVLEPRLKNNQTMHSLDVKVWNRIAELQRESSLTENMLVNQLSRLINYPWIRIVRSDFACAKKLVFAPTRNQNDVPYHWQSLLLASKVAYFNGAIVTHKAPSKYAGVDQDVQLTSQDKQLTSRITDDLDPSRIEEAAYAYLFTAQRIFHVLRRNKPLMMIWNKFVDNNFRWNLNKVENIATKVKLQQYVQRIQDFMQSALSKGSGDISKGMLRELTMDIS